MARFFQTYWKLIYGFAIRCGCSDAEAEEVVQETVARAFVERCALRIRPELGLLRIKEEQRVRGLRIATIVG